MRPDDLKELAIPEDPRLSPDGASVAYVVSIPDTEDDVYRRSIWLDGERRTRGPGDSKPRWSPDGTTLGFLRKEPDLPTKVMRLDAHDGEPETLAEFELGVEALEWSPDGNHLAVTAVTYSEDWQGLEDEERSRRPRRITRLPFRSDDRGWTDDRRRHIWLLDSNGAKSPCCLTPGPYDEEQPAWSTDGKGIAFITSTAPQPGLVAGNEVWRVDISSGELEKVVDEGLWGHLSYSPEGDLHLLGNTDPRYPVTAYLHRVSPDGSLTNLTDQLDRSSISLAAGPPRISWSGDRAVVGIEDSGRFGVIAVTPDGDVETLVGEELVVTGFDSSQEKLAYTAGTPTSPGELFIDGEPLTQLNQGDLGLMSPDHFRVESGGHEIDVWVYLPPGDEPVPTLLNMHGGPASQYGFGFFDEFQVYAGAGFGVVACNPRGSSGRGEEFVHSVIGDGWGEVDHIDVDATLTAALERHPRLDPDRLGIMGGSYGGFLTAWIIAREDRWKSAVVERALISWPSFSGTSDIGGVFPEHYTRSTYPDAWDAWWEKSPLATAHQISTPTLVLHAEDDFRCPIEQAEQFFMALLRNGTTTEMVRFPGESHEMSRSGSPRHRLERFQIILDWHDRHLRN